MTAPFPVALVGVGKIARDQHIPAIAADPDFELVSAVSRHATVEGVANYPDLGRFLAEGPPAAVVLCVPPAARTPLALEALAAGRDVMLEKPPAATFGEVERMVAAARARGCVLFATWHSRFAPAVAGARAWLAERVPREVRIVWKEDVRRWHPGQAWIWQAGGFGVFDPGINALSVLTEILPGPFAVDAARLTVPENCATPIAAELAMTGAEGYPVRVELDWRQEGPQTWDIAVETDRGRLDLSLGGAAMAVDGREVARAPEREYPLIYRRFAELLRNRRSEVDASPLRIVADAFLVGEREATGPFVEERA
ncbi:Gfo/Idh/MocA family oxidoreductase [Amaricoccus sp.]|uniref:Gfo/Idh/MocA family protein n=1 Tax=Amaricoccus sp. TaxID=1872485 RepID=UPI00262EB1A6|nr:Gfo/Idh/MocA family oxidoreductase [Amaricoccus sp.]HRO11820.1 Gfo/Idh/MocA family oxidoreductase [Amaricoccus sp.]